MQQDCGGACEPIPWSTRVRISAADTTLCAPSGTHGQHHKAGHVGAPLTLLQAKRTQRGQTKPWQWMGGNPGARHMKLKSLKPRIANLDTQRAPSLSTDRLRGRAAVDRRAEWLSRFPLCAHCDAVNVVTLGTVVDHIVPLWKGGADDYETNAQTLCTPHHDIKTASEAAERAGHMHQNGAGAV